jgi:hypothetical protein
VQFTIHREFRKAALEAIQLGDLPMGSYPRISNGVSRFKAGSVWASLSAVSFNPIVFFYNSCVKENGSISPEEVFEMQGTGGDLMAFV